LVAFGASFGDVPLRDLDSLGLSIEKVAAHDLDRHADAVSGGAAEPISFLIVMPPEGRPPTPQFRTLAHYLGHRNLQSTARYTALAPDRFAKFWKD
jgi:hypothetical protein